MILEDFLKVYDAETDLWVTLVDDDFKCVRIIYDMGLSLNDLRNGGDGFGWTISNYDMPLSERWRKATIIKIGRANKYGEAKLMCLCDA